MSGLASLRLSSWNVRCLGCGGLERIEDNISVLITCLYG